MGMAALTDATQGESAYACITEQQGRFVAFSFEAVRLDGVICKVLATNEVSQANSGIINELPVGSMQKVMYLKADPKICRLEKFAQLDGENCNNVLIALGWVFLLAASAFMFIIVKS